MLVKKIKKRPTHLDSFGVLTVKAAETSSDWWFRSTVCLDSGQFGVFRKFSSGPEHSIDFFVSFLILLKEKNKTSCLVVSSKHLFDHRIYKISFSNGVRELCKVGASVNWYPMEEGDYPILHIRIPSGFILSITKFRDKIELFIVVTDVRFDINRLFLILLVPLMMKYCSGCGKAAARGCD